MTTKQSHSWRSLTVHIHIEGPAKMRLGNMIPLVHASRLRCSEQQAWRVPAGLFLAASKGAREG